MAFEIFPAIDLRGGRCVRLLQGDYERETVFSDDPVGIARRWAAAGARWLHIVDLDGAHGGVSLNLTVVAEIAAAVPLPIQLGGGIRDRAAVLAALHVGVQRVIVGTSLISGDPQAVDAMLTEFGERIVVGVDARDGHVAVQGWTETTDRDAIELARALQARGARRLVYTDISSDGMLAGPNVEGVRRMVEALSIPVIAAGGVSKADDARQLATLESSGLEGAIIGKALYTGAVRLEELL
jgi:phosphoribosylformimino-5-aminoimidazole carboxamide ribotide isomerase